MIDLTVKTLDSQNHAFSVPDDTTVKQLKEKIAESISFPVDSQRLIYCGRVLQDDKNLSEYDVNGKVIHLVQRPPPSARPNGSQSSTRTGSQPRRTNHHFRQSRLDGNAMYLGAMAFPADLMDAQGIQAPPPSHNLSMSRLELARRMLRRARVALNRLENPRPVQEGADTDSPPEETDTASSSNGENGNGANDSSTSGGPNVVPFSGSIAQAAQAATAAAIAAAVSAAHAASVSNITIVRGGDQSGDVPIEDQEVTISTTEEGAAASTDTPMQDSSSPPEAQPQAPEAGATASSEERPQRSQEPPRTIAMSDILDELGEVNQRLRPFLAQYHQLMRDDPPFEPNSPAIRESQRVFRLVSEIMHYLSHAYHALSDTMCDFSQPPPRLLRCRPVLIQHSAVLQAGIPIQAQINVMANRGNSSASSNTNHSEQENSNRSTANGPTTTTTGTRAANIATPIITPIRESSQSQEQRPRVQETTFNITPGNVEFFMEVGPGSITIDSLEATVVTNGNASGVGSGGVEGNVIGGGFPWGSPPPPEFIQNLMHAVAGHMINRNAGPQNGNSQASTATTTSSSSATTTVTAGGASAGVGTATGQNSQARVNTATHPTTATQTRSTSRPHVHLAPAMQRRARLRRGRRIHFHFMDGTDFDPPPGLAASNFDPFLPCNSHHLRSGGRLNIHPFQQHIIANLDSQAPSSTSSTTPAAASQGEETRSTTPPGAPSEQNARPQAGVQSTPSQEPTVQQAPSQSQQQASPQQPTQQQPTAQQEAPRPVLQEGQNLLDLVSTLLNNLPPGPGGGRINLGSWPQMPPRPSAPTPPRSTTANATPPPTLPPGMALFLNMANGQGSTGAGENNLFNMPMMAQMFEGLSGVLSGALQGQTPGEGNTIADFLQTLPDHSYTEGSSLFLDLLMALARCMTFQDIISLSLGNADTLNRIRPQLRQFVSQRLLENESMSGDTVARGVDKLLREIRPHLDVMLEARLREDVDLITSMIRYNQIRLPEAIQIIMRGGNESTFGRQIVQWCKSYIRELIGIVRYCCLDDLEGINLIIRNYVQQLTRGINPALQLWTVNSSLANLQSFVSSQTVLFEDIQQFLVYRIPSSSPVVAPEEPAHSEPVNQEPNPEPMEMDNSIGEPQASSLLYHTEAISSPLSMDTETLPDVVLGSEAWHNVLPSDWVPIITRDTQRQRRQSSQAPFSDAYLSGMPSKRRKIVTAAKPQGNMNQVITDGVRRSIDDASVRPVNGIEYAGEDIELQAAYREQVRSTVEQNLASSSDFTPERFPNATKYFK